MAFLTNIWTRYTDRTANQIKTNVLTNLGAQVPEITDHSESNIFVKLINIFSGIMELINYYIDNMAREAQMDGARIYSNVVKLSRSWDYRISSAQPSTVLLTIAYTSTTTNVWTGITIPLGAVVQTPSGIKFRTTQSLNIPAGSFTTAKGQVSAINVEAVPYYNLVVGNGLPNQVYVINDKVAAFSVIVKTGANVWTSVETLALSMPTDYHFVQTINELGQVVIKFGDGVNGQMPPNAVNIEVQYDKCNGVIGNVESQTITQIVSGILAVVGYTVSVTNLEKAVAGVDSESVVKIKQGVARLVRTQNRAVTELDFLDIALLHPQVENAGIIFTCGKTVSVYIVPIGGGIAPPALLASVVAWYNDNRRIITHRILAYTAGEIHIQAVVNVTVRAGFDSNTVKTNVENAWLAFFAPANQKINGSVRIGDIYEAIENTEGVQVSEINLLSAMPFARAIGITANVLDWTVVTLPASTIINAWSILITSPTQYQLLKNGNFVGTFTIGVLVTQTELAFTVNASSYVIGDKWEFNSYPYDTNTISLNEPSIPVSTLLDLTLNMVSA